MTEHEHAPSAALKFRVLACTLAACWCNPLDLTQATETFVESLLQGTTPVPAVASIPGRKEWFRNAEG